MTRTETSCSERFGLGLRIRDPCRNRRIEGCAPTGTYGESVSIPAVLPVPIIKMSQDRQAAKEGFEGGLDSETNCALHIKADLLNALIEWPVVLQLH
ncbi:hypothetical protein ANOBCDAF_00437 [Pleomorphomonas sp. T1.2MG-36]|nr:hypothetical protein ANOBCDAF_00437 [Pleomorphomonas sp. T1.2MG-36]